MKKFIKINQKESGEYSAEEIIIKFDNLASKIAWNFYRYTQTFEMHTSHIDAEDLKQVAFIGIINAYNKYDLNYVNKGFAEDNEVMGFVPYARRTAEGEVLKFIRGILKVRRKDYNVNEIALSSIDKPILGKDDNEMFLKDIIEDISSIEDIKTLELKLEIEDYMKCLNERQKNIVYDSFFNNMTQKQLSRKYGVSQVQIGRTIKKSLEKMKVQVSTTKRNIKKPIHTTTKEDKDIMKKETIDTNHVLSYLKKHVKDERPLEEIIDRYCNSLDISESELKYVLHTTCQNEYNKVVDLYLAKEAKKDKYKKDEMNVISKTTKAKTKVENTKKEVKEDKQATDIFKGINVLDITVELDSLKAIITQDHIILNSLPEDIELSMKDLLILKNDIDRLIELKQKLSLNSLKKIG